MSTASGPVLPGGIEARRRRIEGAPRVDGTPVHLAVAEVGDPAAPAVVLAHGVGSSARFVAAACAAPLVAAGWRLVVYDARGHGHSTPCPEVGDHHLDAHVADLGAVVTAAGGSDGGGSDVGGAMGGIGGSTGGVAAVGGVSLGGHAALRWHGTAPRVVCLPAWSGVAPAGEGPHASIATTLRRDGLGVHLRRLREDRDMPRWLRETLVTDQSRHDAASLTAALLALDGGEAPTREEVAALGAPLAVVAWRGDPGHPFEVAEQLVGTAPTATLTELSLGDLDERLTRFGDAVVTAVRSVGAR